MFYGTCEFQLDEEKLSSTLQSINVSRVDLEHCKYLYRNKYTIHDRDICYGSGEDSKDACKVRRINYQSTMLKDSTYRNYLPRS